MVHRADGTGPRNRIRGRNSLRRDDAQLSGASLVLACVAASLPMFMASLDNLVATFALPVIRAELQATAEQTQWFVNSYTLLFAALMLPLGALGDKIGRRVVFIAGVVIFTATSVGAAMATTAEALIAARALQGIGAAAIVPLSLTIVSVVSPEKLRPITIGIWGGVNGLGVAAGPIIGGAVVEGLDWPAIFWLNVPVGIFALILIPFVVPETHGKQAPFDLAGTLLFLASIVPFVWAVVQGESRGWSDGLILGAFAFSAVALVVFVMQQRASAHAMLPVRFFREGPFALSNLAALLFSAGVFGAIYLLSQFLQIGLGYGSLEAGLRAAPWTLAPMIFAPLSALFINKWSVESVLTTGLIFQTVAIGWLAIVADVDVAYSVIVPPMVLAGVGMGLTLAPLAQAVLIGRSPQEQGIASSVNNTARKLGVAVGIALSTAIFIRQGNYTSGEAFLEGMVPSLVVSTVIVGVGTLAAIALWVTRRNRVPAEESVTTNGAGEDGAHNTQHSALEEAPADAQQGGSHKVSDN